MKYKIMAVSLLLSLVLLAACQSNENNKSTESSSSQRLLTSNSSNSSSTSSEASSTESASQSSSSSESSQSSASVVETEPAPSTSSEVTDFNLTAISQGDLSSIAGTYPAAKGGMDFTLNADGTGAISKSDGTWTFQFGNYRMENGMAVFQESSFVGATYYVVPAGVASPNSMFDMFGDDSSRNRVLVQGEGVNVFFLD